MAKVRHGKRYYKQMSLEVATRNPERFEDILRCFDKFDGIVLDDGGILEVYAQLFIDGVVESSKINVESYSADEIKQWIRNNCSHNNEWGFPTGYQAAFTRYLKTLSEFGFIYAQHNEQLKVSQVAKAVLRGNITLSESFALQSMRFWRKSPYRRVLNDFNFFDFIIQILIRRNEEGHKLSYLQFVCALFSDDGNVGEFVKFIEENKIGADRDKAYKLLDAKYSNIDDLHKNIVMQNSVFDYADTVFRVLHLTGFVTVDYDGILLISPNSTNMPLYYNLKDYNFSVSEEAKDSEELYFEELGSFNYDLERVITSQRESVKVNTSEYNKKIPTIIEEFGLTKEVVENSIRKLSLGGSSIKNDVFAFIPDPVKLELLLTIFVYMYYGDEFEYKPNYICGESGLPYSHAPGNVGDIEVFNSRVYWLIEATLIRAKAQQINNETVNLFRHIVGNERRDKFLSLVAPYIHADTKLIFNVATVITMMEKNNSALKSSAMAIDTFIENVKERKSFEFMLNETTLFLENLKTILSNS